MGRSRFHIKSPTLSRAHSTHPIKTAIIITGIITNHEAITSHRSAGSGRQSTPCCSLLQVTNPGRVLVITTSRNTSNSAKFQNSYSDASRGLWLGSGCQAEQRFAQLAIWRGRSSTETRWEDGLSCHPPDPLWTHRGPSTARRRTTGFQACCRGPSGGLGSGSPCVAHEGPLPGPCFRGSQRRPCTCSGPSPGCTVMPATCHGSSTPGSAQGCLHRPQEAQLHLRLVAQVLEK